MIIIILQGGQTLWSEDEVQVCLCAVEQSSHTWEDQNFAHFTFRLFILSYISNQALTTDMRVMTVRCVTPGWLSGTEYFLSFFFIHTTERSVYKTDDHFLCRQKKTPKHISPKNPSKNLSYLPSIPLSRRVATYYYFHNTLYKKKYLKNLVVRFQFYLFSFIRTSRVFAASLLPAGDENTTGLLTTDARY